MNFIDKKVSIEKVVGILAQHDIHIDEDEATVILDLLYLMSKNLKEPKKMKIWNLKGIQNCFENTEKQRIEALF